MDAGTARKARTENEDLLSAVLHCRDGKMGGLDRNWLTPTKIRERMSTGEKGMFKVDYITQDRFFYENNYVKTDWDTISNVSGVSEGDMVRFYIERAEPLKIELKRFLQAASGETVSIVKAEDALAALKIVHKIVEAGRDRKVIRMAE